MGLPTAKFVIYMDIVVKRISILIQKRFTSERAKSQIVVSFKILFKQHTKYQQKGTVSVKVLDANKMGEGIQIKGMC